MEQKPQILAKSRLPRPRIGHVTTPWTPGDYFFYARNCAKKFCSHFQNLKPVAFVVLELFNFFVEGGGTTPPILADR